VPEEPNQWYRVAEHLRSLPGVENAAFATFALMSGSGWNGYVWANGRSPQPNDAPWFLGVSPAWFQTMKVPLRDGRPFRPNDAYPGVGIVNETFVQKYFDGENPVGKTIDTLFRNKRFTMQIVGVAADAHYTELRESVPATVYVPFPKSNGDGTLDPEDSA